MICEHCQERVATIHYQEYVNGSSFKIHLCTTCAQQLGIARPDDEGSGFTEMPMDPAEQLWSQFFGLGSTTHQVGGLKNFGETQSPRTTRSGDALRCPECGMTLHHFAKSSLLGCAACYRTFKEALDPVLKRMQAGNRHVGRKMTGGVTAVATDETDRNDEQGISEPNNQPEPTESETIDNRYQRLKDEQAAAVEAEDYEKAARIRDQIRALDRDGEPTPEAPTEGGSEV